MKTRMMMIVAMIGVIAMANSAMAVQYTTDADADGLDFFDPLSWSPNGVPGATDSTRIGQDGSHTGAIGSMIYDPANQSTPANEALYQLANVAGQYFYIGSGVAGAQYTFYHESGNLESLGSWQSLGSTITSTYVMNGGSVKFSDVYFEGADSSIAVNGGSVQAGNLHFTAANSLISFGAGSDGILLVDESTHTVADMLALIGSGEIVALGGEEFLVSDVGGFTEVKLLQAQAPAVPEPSAFALTLLGLLGLCGFRRRRCR